MRYVVSQRWIEYTEPLEGGIPYLYADIRNLITIAYGDLVDPLSRALSLALVRPGGALATQAEITAAWLAVKGDPNAALRGHRYARGLTTLRLTPQGMADLALGKLEANDTVLRARLPDFEEYPACAQMALHSLSWACGPGFHFPKLISACQAQDWDAAAVHIQMNEWTPEGKRNAGLVPRNTANRVLMRNASRVQAFHLDPDLLNWTHDLSVADEPTLQELPKIITDIPPPPEETSGGTVYPHADPHYFDLDRDPDDVA